MKKIFVFSALWGFLNASLYLFFFESAYKVSWGIFLTLLIMAVLNIVMLIVGFMIFGIKKIAKKDTQMGALLRKSTVSLVLFVGLMLLQIVISEQFIYVPGDTSMNRIETVELNGTKQYISIRSTDETNPVLLFLAGGPGGSQMQATREHFDLLEEHFTIVNWEQPGSGKSYASRAFDTLTPDVYLEDAHALTTHLKDVYEQDKIYLMGESWGSYLGVLLATSYPEDYEALVTTGQMVDFAETEGYCYDEALRIANENDDQGQIDRLESLESIPPRGDNISLDAATYLNYLHTHMATSANINATSWDTFDTLLSPEYSIGDSLNFFRGLLNTFSHVYQQLYETDLRESHTEFDIPIHILHGEHDVNAPVYLVDEYHELIEAPEKTLVYFERSGHNPWITEPEHFQETVLDLLNP